MADLKTYKEKRRFGVTPEPKGKVGSKKGGAKSLAFVMQKHDATRLHYDLRLELDGVMKSWAVTRGPSLDPSEKRLAVAVEDHPIDYNKFEGTIPKGEYGGGTVMLWDRGTWTPEHDAHKGLKKGHLSFFIEGEKLHGLWHLVRLHKRPGEKRENWLLIKSDDEAARKPRDKDILEEEPLSVTTGRTMEEIAQRHQEIRGQKDKDSGESKDGEKDGAQTRPSRRCKAVAQGLFRSQATALPDFVRPCLATLADKAPDSGNWIHEIKFDGYRLQARLEAGKVTLLTRNGLDWTKKFPAIAKAVAALKADKAQIDGELVVEDPNGVSSFSLLQQELKSGRQNRLVFFVFDLMHLNGADLRPLPLLDRKAALAVLLKPAPGNGAIRLSESIDETGSVLLKHACRMHLEGIISKRSDAPYRSGRGHDWLKTKCTDRQEFVIAGFVAATNDARAIGALVLGVFDKGKLRYAGRTGTGFTHSSARELYRKLNALKRDRTPFDAVPAEERGARGPVWVEPKLVAEIDFHGWTHGDRIRHASFQGLREDKAAKEVVHEVKDKVAAAAQQIRNGQKTQRAARENSAKEDISSGKNAKTVGGITLSHPERVYWEDAGVTKQDLAEYYSAVWKWMARISPADRFRCCAVPKALPVNASSRSMPPPASRPTICISSPRKATRSSPSTISTACYRWCRLACSNFTRAAQPPTTSATPTGWCSISIPDPAPAGKTLSPRRATFARGFKGSSSRAF